MKKDIHPDYKEATITCACGHVFHTRSTKPEVKVELCSQCHPFYTGKRQKLADGGRVERFQKKYGLKQS